MEGRKVVVEGCKSGDGPVTPVLRLFVACSVPKQEGCRSFLIAGGRDSIGTSDRR